MQTPGQIARSFLAAALAIFAPLPAPAQHQPDQHQPEQYHTVDSSWRVQAAAGPAQTLAAGQYWTSGNRELQGTVVRFQTELPADPARPLAIFVPETSGPYRLWMGTRLLGGCGGWEARMPDVLCPASAFALPDGAPAQHSTLLMEFRAVPDPGLVLAAGPHTTLILGTPQAIRDLAQGSLSHEKTKRAVDFAVAAACVLAGLVSLLLLAGSREREYTWFALLMVVDGAIYALTVWSTLRPQPGWMLPLGDTLNDGYMLVLLLLVRSLLRMPADTLYRVVLGFSAVITSIDLCRIPLGELALLKFTTCAEAAAYFLGALFLLWRLLCRAREGDAEARLLLAPFALVFGGGCYSYIRNLVLLTGRDEPWLDSDLLVLHSPYPVYLAQLTDVALLMAMMAVLLRRFTEAHRREERYASELAAARGVQQLLLPEPLAELPGFVIEAEYRPAQVVGGDFYQLLPDGDGGLVLVVGDVAGKGLPAAMLVAMIVGVVRTQAAASGADPCRLIRMLNERLLGRTEGGFSTCLAAHLSPDGELTLVNAGHLPPYRNGVELPMAGSLPLGLLPGAGYEAESMRLERGDQLTFLTDGIVEATNRRRELLGFARASELSRAPAAAIVQAAQEWGQCDDLTVIKIEYRGQRLTV